MAIVNLNGSNLMTGLQADPVEMAAPGFNGAVRSWTETIEVGASDSVNSTYAIARLPSNARLLGASRIYTDDLASSGAPTIDVGVFNLSGQSTITDDDDAINAGIDVATVTDAALVNGIENYGKKLYEYVSGQAEDPKGDLDITLTLKDADVDVGGTITVEIFYTLD
jgi:hypothetical protein